MVYTSRSSRKELTQECAIVIYNLCITCMHKTDASFLANQHTGHTNYAANFLLSSISWTVLIYGTMLQSKISDSLLRFTSLCVQAAADGKTAALRLRNLRADAERAREALTVGEQSLKVARERSMEVQKLVNPLNHPRVAELLGRK